MRVPGQWLYFFTVDHNRMHPILLASINLNFSTNDYLREVISYVSSNGVEPELFIFDPALPICACRSAQPTGPVRDGIEKIPGPDHPYCRHQGYGKSQQ
jgi:hypothetical protein